MTELLRYKTANPSFEVPWIDARFLDALPSSPDLAPKQPPPQLSAQHLKEMEELKGRLRRCALASAQVSPLIVSAASSLRPSKATCHS